DDLLASGRRGAGHLHEHVGKKPAGDEGHAGGLHEDSAVDHGHCLWNSGEPRIKPAIVRTCCSPFALIVALVWSVMLAPVRAMARLSTDGSGTSAPTSLRTPGRVLPARASAKFKRPISAPAFSHAS